MKLFVAILKLTIIFIKLTKKKRTISPEPMGRPPSRAETPTRRPRRVEEGGCRNVRKRIIERFRMKIWTTWPATQVGPRPVKAGLGGHEEGVRGVDDGVENASPLLWKRVRTTTSECTTFSGFRMLQTMPSVKNRILKHLSP